MSTPKFEVIIPVVNPGLANTLIKNMEENTLLPQRIIIINNTEQIYMPRSNKFLIEIYHTGKGGGKVVIGTVNESLNLGISKTTNCDYVSIFNDDIQIGPWFFERIVRVFKEAQKCSAACPYTIIDPKEGPLKEGPFSIQQLKKRQGWCVTFRKEVLDKVPKIPDDRIQTFHGDDWFWLWTTKHIKMAWYIDMGNMIYHMIGQSILKLGKRKHKRREKNEWNKIMRELHELGGLK